jgi:hypothetical protein
MASTAQDVHEFDSDFDSLTSTQSALTPQAPAPQHEKKIHHQFSCWTFQLICSADATALNVGRASGTGGSVTLQ